MRRLFLPLLLIAAVLVPHASEAAKRTSRVRRAQADYSDVPRMDRTPVSDATFDSLYTRLGHRIVDVRFFEGFSAGGPRDIPESEIDRARDAVANVPRRTVARWHGATDPERFHQTRKKITDMFNYTLGLARAHYVNTRTGKLGDVSTDVVLNDRRGVYLVVIEPGEREPRAIAGPVSDEFASMDRDEPWTLGPTAGLIYLHADGIDWFTPNAGVMLRKGKYSLYANYGRTFEDPDDDDRVMTSGLRVGDPLFFQAGFIDARMLIPFFDEYLDRAVGGTVGLGYAFHPGKSWDINVNGGVGIFNMVTQDELEDHWEPGVTAGANVGFTF